MSPNPANERPPEDEPLPAPDEVVAWQEKMDNMTWEEFCQFLEEGADGLPFAGA